MKIIFTISLMILAYCSMGQNPELIFGRSGTSIVLDPEEVRVRDVQVTILEQCALAIKSGDDDKAVLWYVMAEKLIEPDIVFQYEVNFPITLQLHIDRKSKFQRPAQQILTFLKTKKI